MLTNPFASEAVVMLTLARTLKERARVAVWALGVVVSVAWTTKLKRPAAVGVA